MRYIFHLSIPVDDLPAAREFYEQTLGAKPGRTEVDWHDVLLWGHQITLQLRPDEVMAADAQGKRHFGVVLPWLEWERLAASLVAAEVPFLKAPAILEEGTPGQHAKLYLQDPSNNILEIKAYKDFAALLGTEDKDYQYEES